MSSFTGVRPLLRQDGDTLAFSREHRVLDEDGLVTIAGGKLTTWRTMALATVDAVVRRVGRGGSSPRVLVEEPLPGGAEEQPSLDTVLAEEMARHLEDVVFRRLPIGHDPQAVVRALPGPSTAWRRGSVGMRRGAARRRRACLALTRTRRASTRRRAELTCTR